MTETSRFWDGTTVGDATTAPYDAGTEFAQVMAATSLANALPDRGGVWLDDLGALLPTRPSANTLRIGTGRAHVYGSWYQNDAALDTNIPTPSVSTRIDRLVLRKSWAAQTVRITRIAGAEGGAAPAITQSAGTTWDVPLCRVSITTGGVMTVTDDRQFVTSVASKLAYNYLVNPGFEIWQRGTGPFTATNTYSADMWLTSLGGTSTISISRDSTNNAPGSWFCAAVTYTHNTVSYIVQKLESAIHLQLRGRSFTFSMQVRTATASAVRLYAEDGIGTWQGSYHSGSGSYETLTVTGTVGATASALTVRVSLEATATIYLDNGTLNVGSLAADYIPFSPHDDLARCLRYYEICGAEWAGLGRASATGGGWTAYAVKKAVTPTVTKNGSWALNNMAGQPSVFVRAGSETTGFGHSGVTSGTDVSSSYVINGSGQNITAEASP